ncbi:PDZ domain-containing protein [bacterium]|nr:PDZ domain-containing protein [bacterium]
MRALTNREWMTVGIGGAVVVVLLVWTQLISPGMEKLESNSKRLNDLNKNIATADKKISQGSNLAKDYKNLTERYSNALETITAQKMPDNLARTLREEFSKLDSRYGSSITSTAVKQPQTNDMYSDFSYNLKDVKCDWKSLNAALGLIESAGQLVGFDAMKIKSNLKDPSNPQAVVDMSVRSFVFNDSEDKDLPAWNPPDYDALAGELKSDIFSLPAEVQAAATRRNGPNRSYTSASDNKDDLPSWTKHIQFNGISKFGDKNFALFYNKSSRSTFPVAEGEKIADTEATVTYIDGPNQKVTFEENGETKTLKLRSYGDISEFINRPFSFQYDLPSSGSAEASQASGEEKEEETAAVKEEAPAESGPAISLNDKETEVPEEYEKSLGTTSQCMMNSGMYVIKVDAIMQKRNKNLKASYGMLITNTQKLGPGELAGLQSNDVLMEIGGLKVDSVATYTYAMNKAYSSSKTIPVKYMRGSDVFEANVSLK